MTGLASICRRRQITSHFWNMANWAQSCWFGWPLEITLCVLYSVGKSRQHSYKAEYRDPIRTHPVGLKAMSNQLWESSFTLLCVFWKKWIALNVTILRHHHSEPGSTLWGQAAKVQKLSHFENERWDASKLCAVSSFRQQCRRTNFCTIPWVSTMSKTWHVDIIFKKDELFYLNGKHFLFRQKVVSSKLGSSQIHEKLVRVEFQSIIIMRVA